MKEFFVRKKSFLIITFFLALTLIFSSCSSLSDEGAYNEGKTPEERVAEITGHEEYCDCADCWAIGQAVEMIDILREDQSYYGVDAITIERDEEGEALSDGTALNDYYKFVVYYNLRTSVPIPSEGDIWYLTQGWKDKSENTLLYQKETLRGYNIEVEALDGPDLSGTDYVIY